MAVELTNYIDGLDPAKPTGEESLGESDDNHRLIKKTVTQTFAGEDGDRWDTPLLVGPRFLNNLNVNLNLGFYVTLSTPQTITGAKTFQEPIVGGVKNAGGRTAISGNSDPVFGDASGKTVLSSSTNVDLVHRSPGNTDAVVVTSASIQLWAANIFPVGAIYITAGPNPRDIFPFTTWVQVSKGRFVVGAGGGNDGVTARTYGAGNDATGKYKHKLTEAELPAHRHDLEVSAGVDWAMDAVNIDAYGFNQSGIPMGETKPAGSSASHENAPPAFGLFIWQRTA